MNKNPFASAPYTTQQPPLPPGPPPPQPGVDYSHWAGYANQAQAQAQYAAAAAQWNNAAAAAAARPPDPAQNSIYANYGYGHGHQWPRQQQQHPQPPQPQHYHHIPPQVAQAPPLPPGHSAAAPAPYTPFQPAVSYPYAQAAPQPMAQPYAQPQPMFNPHIPSQPMQMAMAQQQHRGPPQSSPQQQPPAKRPRYDAPNPNVPNQHRSQQFQPPSSGAGMSGGRGGGPGSNQVPLGGGGGNRGGLGGNRGGSFSGGGRGRGGGMNNSRGGMAGRPRGGGGFNSGVGNIGRGGGPTALRAHGSRGHLGPGKDFHNRRGPGGSFMGGGGGGPSFKNRNQQHSNSNRNQRDEGTRTNLLGVKDSNSSSFGYSKKDERRRTLTDFKIIGLEISELSWIWGTVPSSSDEAPVKTEEVDVKHEEASQVSVSVKTENTDDESALTKAEAESDVVDDNASVTTEVGNTTIDNAHVSLASLDSSKDTSGFMPHSRIRIYFHTPVSVDDSHSSFTFGSQPHDSRKGKRKKLDDEDGDLEDGRGAPPPPPVGDRSSTAPTEAISEADWLMAAIVEGDDTHKVFGEGEHGGEDGDVDEIGEAEDHQHLSVNAEGVERDAMSDINGVEQPVPSHESEAQNDGKALGDPPGSKEDPVSTGSAIDDYSATPLGATVLSTSDPSKQGQSGDDTAESDPSSSTNVSGLQTEDQVETQVEKQVETQPDNATDEAKAQDESTSETQVETQIAESTSSSLLLPSHHNDLDHLPEPPLSPMSGTLISTSSSSTFGETASQNSATEKKSTPSANRISISYSGGDRRLIIDSEICDSMKIMRREGRIEIQMRITPNEDGFEGILMETLSDSNSTFAHIDKASSDPVLPPFALATSSVVKLIAHLDTERPLSEPKWLKTGDVQDWLRSMFGKIPPASAVNGKGWERKVTVVDPDPPPTIWTVLDGWALNSGVGNGPTERQRFVKTHLSETENLLEILLRLVRGERATPFQSSSTISGTSVSGPLLTALDQGTAHGSQQTHVSLAVLAIFQMTVEYATKAVGANAKKEVEGQIGEIIRSLPSHLTYKSLDGMFKEWKAEKKGQGR